METGRSPFQQHWDIFFWTENWVTQWNFLAELFFKLSLNFIVAFLLYAMIVLSLILVLLELPNPQLKFKRVCVSLCMMNSFPQYNLFPTAETLLNVTKSYSIAVFLIPPIQSFTTRTLTRPSTMEFFIIIIIISLMTVVVGLQRSWTSGHFPSRLKVGEALIPV